MANVCRYLALQLLELGCVHVVMPLLASDLSAMKE